MHIHHTVAIKESGDPLVKKQQSIQHTVQFSGDTFTNDVQFLFCRMHIPTFVIAG